MVKVCICTDKPAKPIAKPLMNKWNRVEPSLIKKTAEEKSKRLSRIEVTNGEGFRIEVKILISALVKILKEQIIIRAFMVLLTALDIISKAL